MVGWHRRLDGCGFEQALGDGDGQGGLVCCSPWGFEESDTAERLNNNSNALVLCLILPPTLQIRLCCHMYSYLSLLRSGVFSSLPHSPSTHLIMKITLFLILCHGEPSSCVCFLKDLYKNISRIHIQKRDHWS